MLVLSVLELFLVVDTHLEDLELHVLAVRCPIFKNWTTHYGGMFIRCYESERWVCRRRAYMHELSCCMSDAA